MQAEKMPNAGEQNPWANPEMHKAANRLQVELIKESGEKADAWISDNAENFRLLVEKHPGILDLFIDDPAAAMAWVRGELPDTYH